MLLDQHSSQGTQPGWISAPGYPLATATTVPPPFPTHQHPTAALMQVLSPTHTPDPLCATVTVNAHVRELAVLQNSRNQVAPAPRAVLVPNLYSTGPIPRNPVVNGNWPHPRPGLSQYQLEKLMLRKDPQAGLLTALQQQQQRLEAQHEEQNAVAQPAQQLAVVKPHPHSTIQPADPSLVMTRATAGPGSRISRCDTLPGTVGGAGPQTREDAGDSNPVDQQVVHQKQVLVPDFADKEDLFSSQQMDSEELYCRMQAQRNMLPLVSDISDAEGADQCVSNKTSTLQKCWETSVVPCRCLEECADGQLGPYASLVISE